MPTLEQEAVRGVRAKRIVEDPIYREAWDVVEAEIIRRWRESPITDHDGQHELRLMLHVLGSVRKWFEDVMDTGKLASAQIEEKQTALQKVRRAVGL